jgi:hypothetical protein
MYVYIYSKSLAHFLITGTDNATLSISQGLKIGVHVPLYDFCLP